MIARRDECAERDQLDESVRQFLIERDAVNLRGIADHFGIDTGIACSLLHRWVSSGEAEVLHPVGYEAVPDAVEYPVDLSFFRWKRPTDGNGLWLKRISAGGQGVPPHWK